MELQSSRKQAKELGEKWYFTGKPCKRGHLSKRSVSSKGCYECHKEDYAKWESKNLDKRAEEKRERRKDNPQHSRALAKARRDRNPDKTKEQARANYRRNKHLFISGVKRYKIAKMRNTPVWSDNVEINKLYKLAASVTRETGVPHHVDHIVPLQGEYVSGLHVSWNLQVIPAKDNLSKGNKWPL